MTTPAHTTLSTKDQAEITAMVDRWLELLAKIPFVHTTAEHRRWITQHALAQPNFNAACNFVNDAMWALRFGEPLNPTPPKPPAKPERLDDVDRERIAQELDAQVQRLQARHVVFEPADRKALVLEAAEEPDLDAARLLVAIRLAAVEERQQGALWDLVEHWVGELAGVGFVVPIDAQDEIVRRALSFPTLTLSDAYLHALFQRLYAMVTTPVKVFSAEVELHLRRRLMPLRARSFGASNEEVDQEVDRLAMVAAIKGSRYRSFSATEEEMKAYEKLKDAPIEAVRQELNSLVAAYRDEVENMIQRMTDAFESNDTKIQSRARTSLPEALRTLRGHWEWLLEGLSQASVDMDSLRLMQARLAAVQKIENLITQAAAALPYVLGEADRRELQQEATALTLDCKNRFGSLSETQRKEAGLLASKAAELVAMGHDAGVTNVQSHLAAIREFRKRALKEVVEAPVVLGDGFFDITVKPDITKLQDWVTAKVNADKNNKATPTNISQAVNDVAALRSKAAGHLKNSTQVFHVSAGKKELRTSCSIFYVKVSDHVIRIVAVGCHQGDKTYTISWSDPDYTSEKKVTL
jgi:hypothetical protein